MGREVAHRHLNPHEGGPSSRFIIDLENGLWHRHQSLVERMITRLQEGS